MTQLDNLEKELGCEYPTKFKNYIYQLDDTISYKVNLLGDRFYVITPNNLDAIADKYYPLDKTIEYLNEHVQEGLNNKKIIALPFARSSYLDGVIFLFFINDPNKEENSLIYAVNIEQNYREVPIGDFFNYFNEQPILENNSLIKEKVLSAISLKLHSIDDLDFIPTEVIDLKSSKDNGEIEISILYTHKKKETLISISHRIQSEEKNILFTTNFKESRELHLYKDRFISGYYHVIQYCMLRSIKKLKESRIVNSNTFTHLFSKITLSELVNNSINGKHILFGNPLNRKLFANNMNYVWKDYRETEFEKSKELTKELVNEIKWNNINIKKEVSSYLRPSLRIDFNSEAMELNYGSTKFGGIADLPAQVLNEINIRKNLALLCQINLKDISHFEIHPLIPKKGVLYFFFEEDLEFSYKSKIEVYYQKNIEIGPNEFTYGFDAKFAAIYTYPNLMSSQFNGLIEMYNDDEQNLEDFMIKLGRTMDYSWMDTIFLGEPIPLQDTPFKTSLEEKDYCIPLLDFSYNGSKYHIGIKEKHLKELDFSQIEFTGANT